MFSHLLQRKRRLCAIVTVSALVGFIAAGVNIGAIGGSDSLQVSAAATQAMVDSPSPSLVQRRALPQDVATLVKHAELVGRTMVTQPVLDRIADRAGIPRDQFDGVGRTTAFVPLALTEPGSEQRASEIEWSRHRYRLEVQANPTTPQLEIYAQAPTTPEALRIVDAAVEGMRDYLRALGETQGVGESRLVQLRQLGAARGGPVTGGAAPTIAVLTFMVAFALCLAALLGLWWWRLRPTLAAEAADDGNRTSAEDRAFDAWPHTTRVLPWMLAGFIALLWLVPFNSIELSASLPIDLKGDRLVLPFIIGIWVLALAAGGRAAPRIRLTLIHGMLAVFLACAFLSVVLDARYLNQSLELDLSFKKLPLIVSYVTLFVIVASVVRRTEVAAFLRYTLVLATILALGMIWEYRFKQNLFYDWSDKLLPGAFVVTADSPLEVDSLGRRMVRGSAGVPLEAVTMLSLALPIALVGLLRSERRRNQLLYAVAACALVAAMFATYRKSALLAPVAVILTVAYFRRRDLLKLAPLGMALIVVVSVLSPGALMSTVSQFTRSDRSAVPTVSDRTADYDAVRPDVWSHLAFGRGWGSYNHVDYRILDSEILHRTIEMGVLGLVSYLLISVSVILVARRPIASRDPVASPAALVGAAAAVAFLVAATLYDVMSFPHGPYIFLYVAGLVAVVIRPVGGGERGPRRILRRAGESRTRPGRHPDRSSRSGGRPRPEHSVQARGPAGPPRTPR
jgi:O-antigen ligase/polysaccharide polymerase Wzy-like membrane protein